jgi:hypothetical protein
VVCRIERSVRVLMTLTLTQLASLPEALASEQSDAIEYAKTVARERERENSDDHAGDWRYHPPLSLAHECTQARYTLNWSSFHAALTKCPQHSPASTTNAYTRNAREVIFTATV